MIRDKEWVLWEHTVGTQALAERGGFGRVGRVSEWGTGKAATGSTNGFRCLREAVRALLWLEHRPHGATARMRRGREEGTGPAVPGGHRKECGLILRSHVEGFQERNHTTDGRF